MATTYLNTLSKTAFAVIIALGIVSCEGETSTRTSSSPGNTRVRENVYTRAADAATDAEERGLDPNCAASDVVGDNYSSC